MFGILFNSFEEFTAHGPYPMEITTVISFGGRFMVLSSPYIIKECIKAIVQGFRRIYGTIWHHLLEFTALEHLGP